MRILLGSGGFRTPERVALLSAEMRSFFGPVERLLFLPYALADHDGYVRTMTDKGIGAGYPLDGIHRHADPVRAVREAPALFVGGGNTFRLLAVLYDNGLLEPIRERVRAGVPYLGISAGCNVAGPTIKTTNDMPITQPPNLAALDLVPFQVNPHYFTGQTWVKREDGFHEHYGETRDDRLREFHEMNETPVVGLWEAGLLRIEDGRVRLLGAPARVFRKGREPVDFEPGAWLDEPLAASQREAAMSRHTPRHERWSKLGPNEYRSGSSVVRYDKGAWWALVSYRLRDEPAPPDGSPEWHDQTERLGPFKRPRNAMMAAEERVLLLGRRHGDNVQFAEV